MWERYGRQMADTFHQHWPSDVPLWVYAEGFSWSGHELNDEAPWLGLFKQLYSQPQHRGMVNGKYNYRFDAVKFAHKVAAIGAAADGDDCDVLIWIDADVITHAQVTAWWLEQLFPLTATIAMIERAQKYPECGFMMFRMPAARKVIRQIVQMYRTGALFDLKETHDSFVIGHVVRKAVQKGEATVHSLAPLDLPKRHPFINSLLLGECLDHLKGTARKQRGKSFPTDLVVPRPEPYWR